MIWEDTSLFEAIRLILVAVAIGCAVWAMAHSGDGKFAFAAPIRERMVRRRQWQAVAYIAIEMILGWQATVAALTPNPAALSPPALTVSLASILTLIILISITLSQSLGWSEFQRIIMDRPLDPDAEELAAEVNADGRQLLHQIRSDLCIAIGMIAMQRVQKTTASEQKDGLGQAQEDLDQAEVALLKAAAKVDRLHELIRSLSPTGAPQETP